MKTIKKIGLVSAVAFAMFALSACDDSSSASSDETGTSSSSVESSDSSVTLSGASAESNGSSDENMEKDNSSSSFKESEPAEVSSSSAKETKNSSDSKGDSFDWSIPKEAYLNPEIQYDSIVDKRDGQVYKTIKIGNQTWMAQNLNYADSTNTPSLNGKSWCINNEPKNCDVVGRLYTWAAAIDSVKLATDAVNPQDCGYGHLCSALNGIVKGICPSGWHLPQKSEWDTLFTAVSDGSTAVGNKFKSLSGWLSDRNGDDDFGFSALPAGLYYSRRGSFESVGKMACFWSSVMYDTDTVYGVRLFSSNVVVRDEVGNYKYMGFSVRCVKDSE